MTRRGRVALVAGFLASVLLLAALLAVVGAADVGAALLGADPRFVAAAGGFATAQVALWGLALRTVLASASVTASRRLSVALYAAAAFANNVTPLGQAGGEPLAALLVHRVTAARYETSLAAMTTVDAVHVVTSLSMALVGVTWVAATVSLESRLQVVAVLLVCLGVGLPALAALAWRRRERAIALLGGGLARVAGPIGRVVPFAPADLGDRLRRGLDRFVADLEVVATDRRRIATALALSATGWLCEVGALYLALRAVGVAAPLPSLLFVVPAAKFAGFTPLPGGFGSIEAALVTLLVAVTALPATPATAAVLVHRGAVYWLPTLLGGVATLLLGVRSRRRPPA